MFLREQSEWILVGSFLSAKVALGSTVRESDGYAATGHYRVIGERAIRRQDISFGKGASSTKRSMILYFRCLVVGSYTY